ncbi:MAG TPA: hypothetical protein PKA49_03775, partial [Tepidiformaceae bacterium]|nr:hypothetical protein [Tepidiformaceae bacterium]
MGRHRVLGADFVNDVDPVATEQRLERQRRHGRLGVVARGTGGGVAFEGAQDDVFVSGWLLVVPGVVVLGDVLGVAAV